MVFEDWRMKVMSFFFREGQKCFFGKKGTACMGVMVVAPLDADAAALGNASAANGDVALRFLGCSIGSEFGGKVDRSELDARIDFLMALLSRRFSARRRNWGRILPGKVTFYSRSVAIGP